ncbi:MAG TPA: DUF4118 domain-containing protein, partial [Burkholderiales bacterium]|nr:DUF4118 domain-containing protein [Burkholderiales bacterium]
MASSDSALSRYAVALAAAAVALALRWALEPWLAGAATTVTLYGAIVVAVWHGGYRSGIVATVAGYLAANILFIAPRGVLHLDSADDVAR